MFLFLLKLQWILTVSLNSYVCPQISVPVYHWLLFVFRITLILIAGCWFIFYAWFKCFHVFMVCTLNCMMNASLWGSVCEAYTAVWKQTFLPALQLQQRSSLISVLTPLDVTRAPCSAVNVLLWASCMWAVSFWMWILRSINLTAEAVLSAL